uniref:Uncharacterized protein n=1 Tax=Alexandrium andersonii TaxID=327968 RepID=A0A7S2J1W9_9DINO|mmetsp:Transcript_92505/g.207110  ORF Transcript_92505/g.207110 Transcript_92505/m.207110 type:complete len:122 (+) Transcript_92505:2-367(+)
MWLDVLLLEEGFASFRAGAACWALLKASADTLDALARQRDQLRSELKPLAVQADALGAPPADWRPRHFFLPWRRWKADWLESMLFQEDLSFMGVHDQAVAPRSSGPGDAVAGTSPATPLLS